MRGWYNSIDKLKAAGIEMLGSKYTLYATARDKRDKEEIILFEDKGLRLEGPFTPEQETVWLNRGQMAELFGRDVKTIGKHIGNALREELDSSTVAKFATVQNEGGRSVIRDIEYYNLDMIISVGYRVKSNRGIAFRKWANSVLKDSVIKGYAVYHTTRGVLYGKSKLQILPGTPEGG